MYCTQCREAVEETEKFCAACGAIVKHAPHDEVAPVETPEETIPERKHTTLVGRIWGELKLLGLTAIMTVAVGALVLYGFSQYSSCSWSGSVEIPFTGWVIHCERSADAIAQEKMATFQSALIERQIGGGSKVSASPYDSIQCVGTDYKLYVALVPYDDSAQGEAVLASYEEDIIGFLRDIRFPTHLVQGRFVGLVSPTYRGGTVTIRGRSYEVAAAGNEHAAVYGDGAIFLHASALGERLHAALAHELGHVVANTFTTGDWVEWARLRGDPDMMNTMGSSWERSAEEDFAEEFKGYAGGYEGDPNIWGNHTGWGDAQYFERVLGLVKDMKPASAEVQTFISTRLDALRERDVVSDALGKELRELAILVRGTGVCRVVGD